MLKLKLRKKKEALERTYRKHYGDKGNAKKVIV